LYGRQLETLLATWGISLILIQTVRLVFGAQNVSVANPNGSRAASKSANGLVLPLQPHRGRRVSWMIVSVAVWRSSVARASGSSCARSPEPADGGVPRRLDRPRRHVDLRLARHRGLGGVALSQLGNVGPELGQGYIIDSFMVVVLGGVGRLAGSVAAALGLGILNKLLEPFAGAVLGKIAVLLVIIVFIQRRPQGLFALKGRVET